MYFLTNRMFEEGIKPFDEIQGRQVTFDLDNNIPTPSVSFGVCYGYYKRAPYNAPLHFYIAPTLYELKPKMFFQEIGNLPQSNILFYIHGFDTLPKKAYIQAEELQWFLDNIRRNYIAVIPMIWPCDNDLGIINDYWDDQRAADCSGIAFARAFEMLIDWIKDKSWKKKIHILAHSMGNRVLMNTINCLNQYIKPLPKIFQNTFLMAADIENESLQFQDKAMNICKASEYVSVYYAHDDRALNASNVSNVKNWVFSRRLGEKGPEVWEDTPSNVYGFNCDSFNNVYDRPIGHTYFLNSDKGPQVPGNALMSIYETIERASPDLEKRITIL